MNRQTKNFPAYSVKVLDAAQGKCSMIVSVFNNVDSYNERILPNAFAKSLQRKLPKGVWMHDWTVPVAKTTLARELMPGDPLLPPQLKQLGGLYVETQFNLNTQRGREAFSDIEFGIIDEFSIGFIVEKSQAGSDGVLELVECTLFEWSPVLVGANPATALISVKGVLGRKYMEINNKSGGAPAAGEANANGESTPEIKTKGEMLGNVEVPMAMSAFYRLEDALWNVVYEQLYYDQRPLEERLSTLDSAFNEFRDIALQFFRAVLNGTADVSSKSVADEIKEKYLDKKNLDTKGSAGSSNGVPAASLEMRADAALAAVQGFANDVSQVAQLRAQDGRQLGETRRLQIKALRDQLDGVLEASTPQPSESQVLAQAARERRIKALQFEADLVTLR